MTPAADRLRADPMLAAFCDTLRAGDVGVAPICCDWLEEQGVELADVLCLYAEPPPPQVPYRLRNDGTPIVAQLAETPHEDDTLRPVLASWVETREGRSNAAYCLRNDLDLAQHRLDANTPFARRSFKRLVLGVVDWKSRDLVPEPSLTRPRPPFTRPPCDTGQLRPSLP